MNELKIKFDTHGLGDCVHAAHALQLWRRRGYNVTVQVEENKKFIWQVAGVNIVQGGGLPNHDYGYPAGFDDLSIPDCDANKVAFGLRDKVMPPLGISNQEAWDELCAIRLDARSFISDQARDEAARFIEGLPRPIVCLHSRGTNWHERKSLSDELACDVQRMLLARFDGSIIILDWDARAPMLGHERIRGLRPAWGQIDPERLCALYALCDLMIGVDSGPFHAAALTNIKTLGVFHNLLPNRCCLPSPSATYLVPETRHEAWLRRSEQWRFAEFSGEAITAKEIVGTADNILSGQPIGITLDRITVSPLQIPGRYVYRRIGYDHRIMELLPNGMIGDGAGRCETFWILDTRDLCLIGEEGVIARLRRDADGVWKGRWNRFERMIVELSPVHIAEHRPACDSRERDFIVGIPTLIRYDLLRHCVDAVLCGTALPRKIIVIDNGNGHWSHPSPLVEVVNQEQNLGVAASWNLILRRAMPTPVLMLNDDIEIGETTAAQMLSCENGIVGAIRGAIYSCFLLRQQAWQTAGEFDENFVGAYCEDSDYARRLSMAGIEHVCISEDNCRNNGPSATKAALPKTEQDNISHRAELNMQYYMRKWGGRPGHERFTTPFGG